MLSRGDLTVSGLAFTDFNFQTFSISHYISPTIHEMAKNKSIRKIASNVLPKNLNKVMNFACVNHKVRFSVRACINIFYNNEHKINNQSAIKDQIKDVKKRQTKND